GDGPAATAGIKAEPTGELAVDIDSDSVALKTRPASRVLALRRCGYQHQPDDKPAEAVDDAPGGVRRADPKHACHRHHLAIHSQNCRPWNWKHLPPPPGDSRCGLAAGGAACFLCSVATLAVQAPFRITSPEGQTMRMQRSPSARSPDWHSSGQTRLLK